ncbi:MAG: ribonuclease P protein component [bacterium]|nr:ribonuclease P protein component [bacterium]
MLPKKHRINKEMFKKVFPSGRSVHSGLISLKITKGEEENARFAFVVSAKTAKKAVDRNKLKRRARHIAAKLLPSFKRGVTVIFFFKKGSEKLDFKELEKEMANICKKAGILQ